MARQVSRRVCVVWLSLALAGLVGLGCDGTVAPDTGTDGGGGFTDGDGDGAGVGNGHGDGDGDAVGDGDGDAVGDGDGDAVGDGDGDGDAVGDGDGDGDGAGGLPPPPSCDAEPGDGCVPSCGTLPDDYVQRTPEQGPPYAGTVWFDPDIITSDDPSALTDLTHTGTGSRRMFDRRTNAFEDNDAHLFDARFGADVIVEVQVNPEFDLEQARAAAMQYAEVIGRLPAFLLADLDTVWIHRGDQPFGGGNRNLLIHTEQGAQYIADGVLEETFLHEATHTSIDGHHADAPNWLAAQAADAVAISSYARDFPAREDLAETLGPYLAVRFRADRLTPQQIATVVEAIPNRLEYLDCLGLSMAPIE